MRTRLKCIEKDNPKLAPPNMERDETHGDNPLNKVQSVKENLISKNEHSRSVTWILNIMAKIEKGFEFMHLALYFSYPLVPFVG